MKFNNKFKEINSDFSVLLEESFRKQFLNEAINKLGSQAKLADYLSSKIGNKIIRESVKNWIKGKHIYGWDILIPVNVLKELCILNYYSLEDVLDKAIKFNPPWNDPKKAEFLIKSQKFKILKKNNKFYLDLATILPRESLESQRARKKLPLFARIGEDTINLWSEASWIKSEIKLKRFIELNNLFFTGSAIYVSEGTTKATKKSYNGSISIGNSEPAIINIFFQWLDSFLISYKFSCKIDHNGMVLDENELKVFWLKHINKNINSINIIVRKEYESNLINNFGVFNVKINVTILKPLLLNLLSVSKKIVFNNKLWGVAYLKGLLASEGCVNVNGVLKEVAIGSVKYDERKFIKKLLKNLDLTFCEGNNNILITNWESFYNLLKYDAFDIPQINNYSKKGRFLEGFKNHQNTQKLMRLFPFKNKKFTANDWKDYYNLKLYISSHKYLKSLIDESILRAIFVNNKKYFYLNSNKLEDLEQIWEL